MLSSVFEIGVFSNRSVFLGVAALALAQATLMYWPLLQRTFGTAPLPVSDLALAALVGALILPLVSVEKWWRARRSGHKPAT
jgi:magnesium-transporting ATPase (P-type)